MSDLVQFTPVRAWDRNGVFAPGSKARFFEPGTTTPRTVYQTAALAAGAAHPTPLVADARGVFPPVYTSGLVRVTVTDASDVMLPGFPLDPAFVAPASGAAASGISFDASGLIPVDNVQEAVEAVDGNWRAGLAATGFGATASTPVLTNFDATGTASGAWRFNAATTGTRPSAWVSGDTGVVLILRELSSDALMVAARRSDGVLWARQLAGSTWGAWQRVTHAALTQAIWDAATSTSEAVISPAKLRAAFDAYKPKLMHLQHRVASGSNGGATSAGARVTRPLNTVATNEITGASLASNVITLPAGTYEVDGYSIGYGCDFFKAVLRNNTASTDLLIGTTERSDNSDFSTPRSTFFGRFTLSATTALQIEHWAQSTVAQGLGDAASAGVFEIYAEIRILQLEAA